MKSSRARASISTASMPWAERWPPSRRNYIQNEIQNAAYEYQQAVERGDAVVVGVNRFKQDESRAACRFSAGSGTGEAADRTIAECGHHAAPARSSSGSRRLEQAARGSENLMPHILGCAEAHATVGEISDRLRTVFGEYQER